MRSGHWDSVLFVAIATMLASNHAAAQTPEKADWNSTPPLGAFEQANSYGPMILPANSMEAAQSFRGAAFEPASDSAVVEKAATGALTPTAPQPAPLRPPSLSPEKHPEPMATGSPRPINAFGLN